MALRNRFYEFQKDTFKFNKRGHLAVSYSISFKDFENTFVENFEYYKRPLIFEEFTEYLKGITSIIKQEKIEIWVNGSFTTDEREPKDIDFVIFVEKETTDLTKMLYEFNQKFVYIDSYFVFLDEDTEIYNEWLRYWKYTFSNSRELQKKGFLRLKIIINNGLIFDI